MPKVISFSETFFVKIAQLVAFITFLYLRVNIITPKILLKYYFGYLYVTKRLGFLISTFYLHCVWSNFQTKSMVLLSFSTLSSKTFKSDNSDTCMLRYFYINNVQCSATIKQFRILKTVVKIRRFMNEATQRSEEVQKI